jgi:uncharacterized protein
VVIGLGTIVNVTTVLLGAALGTLLGDRLPDRARSVVTDALGLTTLLIAGLSAAAVRDSELSEYVGDSAPLLVVLGALTLGGLAGSLLKLSDRLERIGGWFQTRLQRRQGSTEQRRFVEGFVTASLVFCTGPLTILGSLNDGLGNGADQLVLKAALDGFAAIAFAASFGWGVAASALTIAVAQGTLTLVGLALDDALPGAHLAALDATGGLLLVGVAIKLLRIRDLPVADLVPALFLAPLLTEIAARLQ